MLENYVRGSGSQLEEPHELSWFGAAAGDVLTALADDQIFDVWAAATNKHCAAGTVFAEVAAVVLVELLVASFLFYEVALLQAGLLRLLLFANVFLGDDRLSGFCDYGSQNLFQLICRNCSG
jgi:hypothetical protein